MWIVEIKERLVMNKTRILLSVRMLMFGSVQLDGR